MELSTIIPHIEALIFASEKPLAIADLTEMLNNALGFIEDRATPEQLEAAVNAINEKYSAEFYAFEMVQSGGGWQFLTKKEYHQTVAQLYGDKFLKKLSVAAIETLSIIAYKQPVTKSEIELIRGVNCDYAVQKLLEKELIVIAGRKEDAVGKPLIYTTSKSFMDYFGINSADDLPKIREILNQEIIEATKIEKEENNNSIEEQGSDLSEKASEEDATISGDQGTSDEQETEESLIVWEESVVEEELVVEEEAVIEEEPIVEEEPAVEEETNDDVADVPESNDDTEDEANDPTDNKEA